MFTKYDSVCAIKSASSLFAVFLLLTVLIGAGTSVYAQEEVEKCKIEPGKDYPPPSAEDSYYVNSGSNWAKNEALAEFAHDIGGFIPFAAFEDLGHYYNDGWTGTKTLYRTIFENFTNLLELNSQIAANSPKGGFLPYPYILDKVIDGRKTWWDQEEFITKRYFVNGGEVLVSRLKAPPDPPPDPVHILLENLPYHFSDFDHRDIGEGFSTNPYQFSATQTWMGPLAVH
jgi:hypothetical protein